MTAAVIMCWQACTMMRRLLGRKGLRLHPEADQGLLQLMQVSKRWQQVAW